MKKIITLILLSTLVLTAKNCNSNPRGTVDYQKAVACSLNERNTLSAENNRLLLLQNNILKELVKQVTIIAVEKQKEKF